MHCEFVCRLVFVPVLYDPRFSVLSPFVCFRNDTPLFPLHGGRRVVAESRCEQREIVRWVLV